MAFDEMKTETAVAAKPDRSTHGNETYLALVWRRLRRSFTGMVGLVLVALLILIAVFADFFAQFGAVRPGVAEEGDVAGVFGRRRA